LGCAAAALAQTPAPGAHATNKPAHVHSPSPAHSPAFSNTVKVPSSSGRVSAQACDRRSIGVDNSRGQMGPGSTSKSQTLIGIPIGGGAAATKQSRINEACGHTR